MYLCICVFEGMWGWKNCFIEYQFARIFIYICEFVFWRSMRIENEINPGWIPACTWQQMVRSNNGKLTSIIQYALIWQITITRSRKANVSDAFLLKFYHVKKTQLAYHLKSIVGLCGLIWWIYIILYVTLVDTSFCHGARLSDCLLTLANTSSNVY